MFSIIAAGVLAFGDSVPQWLMVGLAALVAALAYALFYVRTRSALWGAVLAIDPTTAQTLASRLAESIDNAVAQPVLLCAPVLRPHLSKLLARALPTIGVVSHSEVPPQLRVASVAVLE